MNLIKVIVGTSIEVSKILTDSLITQFNKSKHELIALLPSKETISNLGIFVQPMSHQTADKILHPYTKQNLLLRRDELLKKNQLSPYIQSKISEAYSVISKYYFYPNYDIIFIHDMTENSIKEQNLILQQELNAISARPKISETFGQIIENAQAVEDPLINQDLNKYRKKGTCGAM